MVQPAARAGSSRLVALGFRTYPNFCRREFSAGTVITGPGVQRLGFGADRRFDPQPTRPGPKRPLYYGPCPADKVYHVGEPVVTVVARDKYLLEERDGTSRHRL